MAKFSQRQILVVRTKRKHAIMRTAAVASGPDEIPTLRAPMRPGIDTHRQWQIVNEMRSEVPLYWHCVVCIALRLCLVDVLQSTFRDHRFSMLGHSKARSSTATHAQACCGSWNDSGTARFRVRTATTKLGAPSRTDTEQETSSKICQIATAGVLARPQNEFALPSTGSDGRDVCV